MTLSMISWPFALFALLYSLVLAGIYSSSLSWLVSHDWAKDDYSYCYLVPIILFYLVWEKRKALALQISQPSWLGLAPLTAGIVLFWLGELGGEYFTLYISFWLSVVSICWLHLGWQKLKIISFPLIFALTMFPLPNFLYNKITIKLKLISSMLGVRIIHFFGLPAFREGNIIDLGFTQLQVIDACSGLNSLISLFVMAFLLAYFLKVQVWKKIILVLSTIPLAIFTNSMRIASVGLLHKYWGEEVAEGFFHYFSGWVIFVFSLGLLIVVMEVLRRIKLGERSEFRDEREKGNGIKEQMELGKQVENLKLKIKSDRGKWNVYGIPHFTIAFILLGSTLALSYGIEFREKIPINKSFDQFPLQVAEWRGVTSTLDQKFINALDLSDYVIIDFQNKEGNYINFYAAYYQSQRKGESIHSPATCLPGSGWIFRQAGSVVIPVKAGNGTMMKVNRAFMEKDGYKQISYYWFPQRGRILTNAYQLKLYTFWDALTKQRTDGALVRVITPVDPDEELENAELRLQEFMENIIPILDEFIPGENDD